MFVPLTPLRCLHRALDLFSNKTGIICGDRSFTYAQFGHRARKLATGLARLGVTHGDRVAYLSFNTHKLLESYYGVVQARAIVMPMNVRLSPREMVAIVNHAAPKVLCYEPEFETLAQQLRSACPNVQRWVALGDDKHSADLTYEELVDSGTPDVADIFSYDENDIAELFYTSGSTGTPKGVALTHRALYLHALGVTAILEDARNTVDLHTIPLFHANGWGRPQVSTLLGFKQVMVRRFDPATVFQLIERHRATDISLVPVMANMLLNAPELGRHDLSSLRVIMIGGAASSPELIERLESAFKCLVYAGYGLTETAPVLTSGRDKPGVTYADDAARYRHRAMAGWTMPGATVRVVDLHGNDVPRDMSAIGEVVAQGDNIMAGYYREPEATAAVIHDNWFHTGDMAVWDEEGVIHIVDRKKEIIISGGENISSLEVERAIFAHDAVLECAVVAAPDDQWGEVPAAVVVLKPGATLTQEALIDFLSDRLGRFKHPRIVEFSPDALPKTGTGKIRKNILKERFWVGKQKRVQG